MDYRRFEAPDLVPYALPERLCKNKVWLSTGWILYIFVICNLDTFSSDYDDYFNESGIEEWVVFLIMGSVLPGYMFRYQYCLVGGLEAIVFGSIRWCVWSFRPSSPLRLPHLKCLLLLLSLMPMEPSLAPERASPFWGQLVICNLLFMLFNYQLPNGPVKAGRRWGQRHPQGANLGSNGIHNFMSKLKQWLPPAHPKSLASQCMSGQPISTCHALTS